MKIPKWLIAPAVCIALLTGPAPAAEQAAASGQEDSASPALGAAPVNPVDSEAMSVLTRMAERLAQAKGFSVSIRTGYDIVQDSGQKIEFGEERTVLLSRPGGLRIEAEQSDGDRRVILFDGKTITVFDPDQNIYAQVDKAGGVDDAVRYLVRDLQVRVPLALLLSTSLPADLQRRIESLAS